MQLFSQYPGDSGIYQTVYMMRELANKAQYHPWIRERAASIVNGCNRVRTCEDMVLSNWVKSKVQYVRDPVDAEALHDPVTFYERRLRSGLPVYGDCDDMSTYLAALLKSIGHQPFFRTLARVGWDLHHVHVVCDGQFLDPTMEIDKSPRQASRAIQFKV